MDEDKLVKILERERYLLQKELAFYQRIFRMSLNVIEDLSHFMPLLVKKFKEEIKSEYDKADIR
tara:strand:- start:2839 stop:3030 length:192 start_codon:yes stop_codon:yes gene_type:complete